MVALSCELRRSPELPVLVQATEEEPLVVLSVYQPRQLLAAYKVASDGYRYVLNSGSHVEGTPEAITRTYPSVKTAEVRPTLKEQHDEVRSALSRRVTASPGTFIHSKEPFAPQLHESFSFATEECKCPHAQNETYSFTSLNILARQQNTTMPMPTRVAPSPHSSFTTPGGARKIQLVDLFSEIYVINLPERTDRRHYMCTIMQRIGADALLWPGFSKYSPIVSAYFSDRRYANSDPITDYVPPIHPPPAPGDPHAPPQPPPLTVEDIKIAHLPPADPQPPSPPPPTDTETTDASTEQDTQQKLPALVQGEKEADGDQHPPDPNADPDPDPSANDESDPKISWGDYAPARPNKRKMFTRAQAACYVTHREVWHNIVHRQLPRPTLVLEDDVDIDLGFPEVVQNAIRSLPSDWAVLFVGHCFEEKVSHEDVRIAHRVYKAIRPACTHAYVLRNSTVAEMLLNEIGHDLVKPVDLGLIALLQAKGDVIPMYVMLPPPITQLWRTRKRRADSSHVAMVLRLEGSMTALIKWCNMAGRILQSGTGPNVANPSDVVVQGLKLPLQRIFTPVKDVVLAEAAAAMAADPSLAELAAAGASLPLPPPLEWGSIETQVANGGFLFKEDTAGLLCDNPLFGLQPPEDAPEELVKYPDSQYLP